MILSSKCSIKDSDDPSFCTVRDYPTAHFHVDAAWAGMMYACPELREKGRLAEVNEFAGSFSVNPHKNGLVGFDCTGTWYVRCLRPLARMSADPATITSPSLAAG